MIKTLTYVIMVLLVSGNSPNMCGSNSKGGLCWFISQPCHVYLFCVPNVAPGSLFVIENPPRITKFIADNSMPIMLLHAPVKAVTLVDGVTIPPRVPVPSSDLQHAFFLVGAKVTLWNCHAEKVKGCGGLLCDATGGNPPKCPCMSTTDRETTLLFRMELHISQTDEGTKFNEFTSRDVTSKRFTKSLLKNLYIPHGFNVTSLTNDRREFTKLIACIENVLAWNNNRGGYNITGWLRKGRQLDPGAVQPTSHYEPKIYIPSGDISYHITSITPKCPANTENHRNELNQLAYDMEAFGAVAVADPPQANGGDEA